MQRIMRNSVNGHSFYISKPSESTSSLRVFVEGLCPAELFGYLMSSFLILCSLETSAIFRSRLISVVGILRNQAVLNPFTGQDVYRRPKLAAFPMGRTCISVLTGLAVSDTEKPRYLVL